MGYKTVRELLYFEKLRIQYVQRHAPRTLVKNDKLVQYKYVRDLGLVGRNSEFLKP